MRTLGISHIGLGAADLDRTVHFYTHVLGLPIVHEMDYNEVPSLLSAPQRPRRRAVYVRAGEGDQAVVLVIGTIDEGGRKTPIMLDEIGIHHFSMWVDDIDALHQRLVESGTEILLPPVDVASYHVDQADRGRNGGPCRTLFFRDPDGIMLQADQRVA